MTDNRLGEIKAIQKRIVNALEKGESVSELTRQLARVRAEIAAEIEIQELQKIADERQKLRDRAEAVKTKIQKQGEAIDAYLAERDKIVTELASIIERAKALPRLHGACFAEYPFPGEPGLQKQLPEGYVPNVPMLEGTDGSEHVHAQAAQALFHLINGLGLLQSLKRVDRPFPQREPTDFESLDNETTEIELNCLVCNHEKVAEINKALENGRPLRELETEFNVSRSTLSRHKNRCLNMGAIRIREDAL